MCDILAGLSGYCHDFALICYQPNFLSQPLHWLITILDLKSILLMRRRATTGWHWPLCGFITRNTFSYTVCISANKVFTDWGGRIVCSSASRLRKGPASVSGRWADTFVCNSLSLHQKPRYILMNSMEYIEKIMGYMAASPQMGFLIYVGINTHNQKIHGILIVLLIFNFDVFFYSTVWHLNCTNALKVQCCEASSPGQQVGLFSQTVFLWPGAGPEHEEPPLLNWKTQPRTEKVEWRLLRDVVLAGILSWYWQRKGWTILLWGSFVFVLKFCGESRVSFTCQLVAEQWILKICLAVGIIKIPSSRVGEIILKAWIPFRRKAAWTSPW